MSVPEEDTEEKVVRLGTETLFAIAEQLRRMYDADLRTDQCAPAFSRIRVICE